MAICVNCEKMGTALAERLSFRERVFLLSSVASMMKWVASNPNAPHEDKELGSSLTTKLLLSFPPEQREALLKQLRNSAGVVITLGNCPHSGLQVVS